MKKTDTEQKTASALDEQQLSGSAADGEYVDEAEDERQEEQYYEERRKERHERILQKKKRQLRNRRLALIVVVAGILLTGGYWFREDLKISELQQLLTKDQKAEKLSDEDEVKLPEEDDPGEAEDLEADDPGEAEALDEDDLDDTDSSEDSVQETAKVSGEVFGGEIGEMPQAAVAGTGFISRQIRHEKKVLAAAKLKAAQYDYDGAIKLLQNDDAYVYNEHFQNAAEKFLKKKDSCVAWSPEEVTHIFYHSLIVDTSKSFDGDYKEAGYNQVMTTMEEFNKITQIMYEKGYVMVNLYDLAEVNKKGNMKEKIIYLPKGKIPFVLSQDDTCYYHSQDGDGIATKLIVDEEGKVRNEYVQDDGSVVVGDYDVVPLIDRFVEEHPDFAYHGHKGVVALTGYNGILGYRTDISYETQPEDLNDDKVAWLAAHPDFDLETERAGAKKVANAMKAEGWTFASHTWGHKNMSTVSMERLITDTNNFKENVDPLIGGTDIIIFAFGADINSGDVYTGSEKFEYLKSQGYDYYCNVDSNKYFVQATEEYFRMGRRNVDGYRMYYNPDLLSDLFDASEVFDSSRPTPVPPMNGG